MSHKQSDPAPRCEDSETSQHVTTTAAEWPPIVFSLAEQFGIDVDCLRRHHVIEMYSAGLDSNANEVGRSFNYMYKQTLFSHNDSVG